MLSSLYWLFALILYKRAKSHLYFYVESAQFKAIFIPGYRNPH